MLLWADLFISHLNQKSSSDEDEEGKEPSFEKQEAMVRKLQRRFPDQDKEVKIFIFQSETASCTQHNKHTVVHTTVVTEQVLASKVVALKTFELISLWFYMSGRVT